MVVEHGLCNTPTERDKGYAREICLPASDPHALATGQIAAQKMTMMVVMIVAVVGMASKIMTAIAMLENMPHSSGKEMHRARKANDEAQLYGNGFAREFCGNRQRPPRIGTKNTA